MVAEPAGGAPACDEGVALIVWPQFPQNRTPGRNGFPQFGQLVMVISSPPHYIEKNAYKNILKYKDQSC
jgi:hypothetical protein